VTGFGFIRALVLREMAERRPLEEFKKPGFCRKNPVSPARGDERSDRFSLQHTGFAVDVHTRKASADWRQASALVCFSTLIRRLRRAGGVSAAGRQFRQIHEFRR
jgi:hypothetical protein